MSMRSLLSILGIGRRGRTVVSSYVGDDNGWWASQLGSEAPPVEVNSATAKTSSTYWCCSTSISADVAKLPFHLYQRGEDNGRTRATQHPAYKLLLRRPNPEMTAMRFREKMQGWALEWGNGFAEIERSKGGKPIAIWPRAPWRMKIRRRQDANRTLYYEYRNSNGERTELDPADVFHLAGPTIDGIVGLNVVTLAQMSLGSVLAADRFTASFYGNNAMPATILKHPGKFKDKKAIEHLRESWEKLFKGTENAGKMGVLEEGMEVERITMPLDSAQFIEQRQFGVAEVCRWFRFPPHKAGDLSRATFSNIEHQGLEYVIDCLGAWFVRWEQEANIKLLTESEQDGFYFEHMPDALLRGDFKSRMEGNQKGLDSGQFNVDEVRARENMPPLPNGLGKIHRVPSNMQTMEALKDGKQKADPPSKPAPVVAPAKNEKKSSRALVAAFSPAFDQAFRNLLRIEAEKLRRAAGRSKVQEHVDEFYGAHPDFVRSHIFPVIESLAAALRANPDTAEMKLDVANTVSKLASRHWGISARQAVAELPDPEKLALQWLGAEASERAGVVVQEISEELDRQAAATSKG